MPSWPGFVGGSYVSQSSIADQQRLINFYVEAIESQAGTTKAALYPTPGVVQYDDSVTGGLGRSHFFQSGREFAVIGAAFVEIPQYFGVPNETLPSPSVLVNRGTVATDSNPATISGNGDAGGELFITSGGNGYLFVLATNTFSTIAALSGKATMGDYQGGYFLALDSSTSTLRISDLLDGATWDPTQFIQRSGSADGWVSMKVNQYVYLLGSKTSEVWFNSGAFPIPFELHPSGRLQYGCEAPFSPEIVGTSLVWLGATANGSGSILRTGGFSIEVISDFATQWAFSQFPTIGDAIGDSYEEFGHTFYLLTFPSADSTWVWDQSMKVWAERSTWNSTTFEWEAWRGVFHAFAFGQHRFLDLKGSGVYDVSTAYGFDFDGVPIRRMRIPPAISKENKRIFYRRMELLLESGLGLTSGQGSDPQVMLRWSDDGGKTWGPEMMRSAGALGEYGKRVYWSPCGSGRKRVPEITFSDPIPFRILDLYVEAEPGTN